MTQLEKIERVLNRAENVVENLPTWMQEVERLACKEKELEQRLTTVYSSEQDETKEETRPRLF